MDMKRYSNEKPNAILMNDQETSHMIAQITDENNEDKSFVYKNPNLANNLSQMNISHLTSNSQVFNSQAPGMIVEDQLARIIFNFITNENDKDLLIFLKS